MRIQAIRISAPNNKITLKDATTANLIAEIEIYAGTVHGWCPLDSVSTNRSRPHEDLARTSRVAFQRETTS